MSLKFFLVNLEVLLDKENKSLLRDHESKVGLTGPNPLEYQGTYVF